MNDFYMNFFAMSFKYIKIHLWCYLQILCCLFIEVIFKDHVLN
jgi:hypothetical protein